MDLGATLLALLIGVVVKLTVMIVGGWLLFRLYKAAYGSPLRRLWLLLPAENLPEIRVLWWALLLFCVSELTCGIEIYVIFQSSSILSGIHSLASGVGMGLFVLGIYLFLDKKLFRYGTTGCCAKEVCAVCTLHAERRGCKFHPLILLLATLVAATAIPPLFTSTERMAARTESYALPFESLNAWYDNTVVPWLKSYYPNYQSSGVAYFLPESMMVIEFRILPVGALAFAVIAIALLWKRAHRIGFSCLMLGAGMLCYVYFELALYRVTNDALLGSLGHEVVEFWFLIATAEFLRTAFPAEPTVMAGGQPS